jgi:hypothetical protein
MWENVSDRSSDESTGFSASNRVSFATPTSPMPVKHQQGHGHTRDISDSVGKALNRNRSRSSSGKEREKDGKEGKEGKERNRWGFLKKMSMGKINGKEIPPPLPTTHLRQTTPARPAQVNRVGNMTPQIDVRISVTGTLGALANSGGMPSVSVSPPALNRHPSVDALSALNPQFKSISQVQSGSLNSPLPGGSTSPTLLAPPSPGLRPKRRSFLPIDGFNLPIPDSSSFLSEISATNGYDRNRTPSPIPSPALDNKMGIASPDISISTDWEADQLHAAEVARQEEERLQDAYSRALRSVMAYLRDMYDLGAAQQQQQLQQQILSEELIGTRSRRPTIVDRDSAAIIGDSHLRGGTPSDRSGTTLSVATIDSTGSGAGDSELKYKDNKEKRSMVVREIVE